MLEGIGAYLINYYLGEFLEDINNDQLSVQFSAMGMPFKSQVEVLPEELVIQIELPAMASMFAGKIREGIEQQVGALIKA